MSDTSPEALVDRLDRILAGEVRASVVDGIQARGDIDDWLRRIRSAMSSHRLVADGEVMDLHPMVRRLDMRTRKDGFRVLHAWNHRTHDFTRDIVPVLMIDFFRQANPEDPDARFTLELLLDYYLFHLLALCAMRVWDAEDPDAALARVGELVEALQGERGSGHRFVADPETLLIYALSQFHPEEHAYDRIIERVSTLAERHHLAFARVSAAVLGAHLRWGFWLMYGRDVVRMRADNVGDYPWLLDSVATLLSAWSRSVERGEAPEARDDLVEPLLLGLAADPWAFGGSPPEAMKGYRTAYDGARAILERLGQTLLEDLERHRPTKESYAPLALHFNFPHNTLVAIVTLALLEGRPQRLALNDLFVRELVEPPGGETQEELARTLMAFSGGRPDRLGHRGALLVAYDPLSAMRSWSMTVKALRESLS